MDKKSKENNPYQQVKQQWNEVFANALASKRNWQVMSFVQSGIILVLIFSLVNLATRSKLIPYIVEVDNLGRAVAYAPAEQIKVLDERVIRAYLFRFVEKSRSVITDAEAMRRNLTEAYKMVTPDVKQNVLNAHYQENNPLEIARTRSRQIIPLSCLKQSKSTFLIEWKEVDRDMSSKVIGNKQWKALITIVRVPPDNETKMKLDPMNPFGIFITSLSWSKIL